MDKTNREANNKITDAPQPKPCSHGTNERMQKQVQVQKQSKRVNTKTNCDVDKTNIIANKIKSQTHHNQSCAVTERINECKNKYKNKKTTASLVRMKERIKRQKQNEICQCKFKPATTNNTGHQAKQTNPLHLNNTDTYTPLSTLRPTNSHQEFKMLLTPGVLKRNRLDLIGSPVECWF